MAGDVRNLAGQFTALNRSMAAPTGGSFAQRQIADMRTLLGLQTQAIQNNNRLASGGGGRGPGGPGPGGSSFWGRRGFSPNASLMDRAQYRGVNLGERSLVEGALDFDRARTQLGILTQARPGFAPIITQEEVTAAEAQAREYSQIFRSLSRGHILDTFRELVPMFGKVEDAFALLPEMLRIQDWQVLQGDTTDRAREGMLSLLRAAGLSGRLIGNDGRLKLDEAAGFMDTFLRARMIGGRDITADQVFQFMKYAKASGQAMSPDALLEAFIAMPDIRGSTFGNQLNMLVRQMTGRATQAAQLAMEAHGLGTITERTASGPHRFQPVDEELLRSDTPEWFQRHIVGPTGVLRRMGIDPLRASSAQIATALSRFYSNQSAENMANAIVNQRPEWLNQVRNARALDLGEEARMRAAGGSTWYQLQAARSGLQDVLGSVAENFKLLLPHLETLRTRLGEIAALIDPKIGNPLAGLSVVGAGGIAGAIMAARGMRGMSPWTRTALGAAGGHLFGGDVMSAVTGALLLRGFGGSNAARMNAAAGGAGAAAGQSWGRRFIGGAWRFARLSAGLWALGQIVENWETVSARLKEIWADLKRAAPTWAGGDGGGWGAFARGPAMTQTGRELDAYLKDNERGIQDLLRGTAFGQWLIANGMAMADSQLAHRRLVQDYRSMGIDLPALEADARGRASVPAATTVNVTGNAITINITAPSADPNAIGEAAGNAVQSGLRGALSDVGPMP